MDNVERPDPDILLARIQMEEQGVSRGRLKIFLGYAAGVGKTYAMLEAARQRQAEGIDVLVGYVETHQRLETEALLTGLEILPRRLVEYRGVRLTEMDVDALLARRPKLALVDELAHTNVPGSRHPKRYQDVEELLAAGIDVYTTLNIQHLESLNDVVAQITEVRVRETIPDSVIDEASEIEVIDLPPDELLKRLQEGKVYIPDQAARAIQKFFRKGNLTALRQMALRRAAERVDEQMLSYMQTRAIPGPWAAAEHLLVCISSSPLAERLVRSARRLADELNAEWVAVYVETPEHIRLPQEQRDRVARTLLLAEELGGKSCILPGDSVAETVLHYARQHNITKIIAGKPLRSRWDELWRGSVVDRLIQFSGPIDVYVISSQAVPTPAGVKEHWRPTGSWQRYAWAVGLVIIASVICAVLQSIIAPTNLVMIYLVSVVLSAAYLGRGPSIVASFLSVLFFDFLFVPPSLTLAVADTQYLLTFAGLLGVGLVISQLTARVRDQAEAAMHREVDTSALYSLSRDLSVAADLESILRAIISNISQTFSREVVIFLPDPQSSHLLKPHSGNSGFIPDENETAVAAWAFQHGQPAGRGTDTLPAAEARYLPMKTVQNIVGVLGVKPRNGSSRLTPEQRRLLEAFTSQAALAIERSKLAEQARQAQILQAAEKLETALLNSISHDLRTPLVSITGALSSLYEDNGAMDAATRRSLLETARDEANRLNRLVGNLLNMTRIEAGAMRVVYQPCDVQDVIGTAVEQLKERLEDRAVIIDLPDELPLIPMDFVLIQHVLVNLLDNAIKYSPSGTPIEIHARLAGAFLEIEIADRGIGIPPEDLSRVFDKFYRVQRPDNVSGTGLGLSICKGIIAAHGGFIAAENRPGGGAIFTLALPAQAVEPVNRHPDPEVSP